MTHDFTTLRRVREYRLPADLAHRFSGPGSRANTRTLFLWDFLRQQKPGRGGWIFTNAVDLGAYFGAASTSVYRYLKHLKAARLIQCRPVYGGRLHGYLIRVSDIPAS